MEIHFNESPYLTEERKAAIKFACENLFDSDTCHCIDVEYRCKQDYIQEDVIKNSFRLGMRGRYRYKLPRVGNVKYMFAAAPSAMGAMGVYIYDEEIRRFRIFLCKRVVELRTVDPMTAIRQEVASAADVISPVRSEYVPTPETWTYVTDNSVNVEPYYQDSLLSNQIHSDYVSTTVTANGYSSWAELMSRYGSGYNSLGSHSWGCRI